MADIYVIHTIWPVSYTHLDVYKRQLLMKTSDENKYAAVLIPVFLSQFFILRLSVFLHRI